MTCDAKAFITFALACCLLGPACTEDLHQGGPTYRDSYQSYDFIRNPYPEDCGKSGDGDSAPLCTTFVTQQGAVCVSCSTQDGKAPVVSCTSGPPTSSSTCHDVKVGGFTCKVCHDAKGKVLSETCTSSGSTDGCSSLTDGDQICLICTTGGKQTLKTCLPSSQSCKSVSTPTEICIECFSSSGKSISKKCIPSSQTCKAETVEGKLCLICRDSAGKELSKICK